MKNTIIVMLMISVSGNLFSQTITRQVIASAGTTSSGGSFTLSWTAGEPVAHTASSATIILTQGFQQPDSSLSVGISSPEYISEMSVYPNPTDNIVNIKIVTTENIPLRVVLLDMEGKSLIEKEIQGKNISEQLDLNALASGQYVLSITTANGTTVRVYNLQKVR